MVNILLCCRTLHCHHKIWSTLRFFWPRTWLDTLKGDQSQLVLLLRHVAVEYHNNGLVCEKKIKNRLRLLLQPGSLRRGMTEMLCR